MSGRTVQTDIAATHPLEQTWHRMNAHGLQTISLAGIPLYVREPFEYLYELSRAVELQYPELRHILGELRVQVDDAANDRWNKIENVVLAYARPKQLYEVVVKDWIDGQENECDPLTNYLTERGLLNGIRTAVVCGAGVGRLSDYLLSEGLRTVTNVDLSWLVLYIGRLLLTGRSDEIPPILKQTRILHEVDEDHRGIHERDVPVHFKQPRITPDSDVRFEVRDCFAFQPVDADAVLACNFVETHRGRVPATLTTQIVRQLRPGQTLLHVTWVSSEEGTGRTPRDILRLLDICGFETEWVDFIQLPYSLHNRFVGSARSEWKNLVVRSRKRTEASLDRIWVDLNRADNWFLRNLDEILRKGAMLWRGVKDLRFAEAELAVLGLLKAGALPFADLLRQLGDQEFEDALAHLAGRFLVTLQIDAPSEPSRTDRSYGQIVAAR